MYAQQIVEFVLDHRCDQPSLEARAASALSRRMIDDRCQCDEAMRIFPSLALQSAREIIGVVGQVEVEEDDPGLEFVREHERA